MIKKSSNVQKDLKKIEKFSKLVRGRLSEFDKKDQEKVKKLTLEELQDLNQLLLIADFILTKYESKKGVHSLLKDFVNMINNSSGSMDLLQDEIGELVVSAEGALTRIKTLQNDVSENYSFEAIKTAMPKPSQA